MSLVDPVRAGRLPGLEALRDRLAKDLDECQSMRDVAALSQRLMDVLKQIDEITGASAPKQEESAVDEFTAARRKRAGA